MSRFDIDPEDLVQLTNFRSLIENPRLLASLPADKMELVEKKIRELVDKYGPLTDLIRCASEFVKGRD